MGRRARFADIVVVGGGHAGAEAAWAASGLGASVTLVTLDAAKVGVMSCNPSIGGLAKGQIVREIDALGGIMGRAADATGIMFKMLNTSRGAAVRGPRCQCDKHAYAEEVQRLLRERPGVTILEGAVERVLVESGRARGVVVGPRGEGEGERVEIRADAVVITTGTFLRALMHTGEAKARGGREGEAASTGMSGALREMGFELGRLKTGTPPRLKRSTIDWDALPEQVGDGRPAAFSDLTDAGRFPLMGQVACRITRTTPEAHEAIRENIHRAPMFSGQIESAGPRYCPSIEDKVVRFGDRDSHHVFLEPESHRDESVYCNGIATSLPQDVQERVVRAMPGCERAEVLKWGYAVEYDMVPPHQIHATCMTKRVEGLFLAGQINGTSGYEEAAAQGLLAGLNAARHAASRETITLGRDQAYIGVMMDDLVTKTPREPYRMFTSRAEHRLMLRADNAADRLTPFGRELGLVCDERWTRFEARREALAAVQAAIDATKIDGEPLAKVVRRPGYTIDDLAATLGEQWPRAVLDTALTERQYEGYLARQRAEVKRQAEMERRRIPGGIEYAAIGGLRTEARQALERFRPETFGQASRLEGVTPADLTILLVVAERARRSASE